MNKSYNIALVLIRFFGLAATLMGIMWLVNIAATFTITLLGAPDSMTRPLWHIASQGVLSGPIWGITGVAVLRFSRRLANFVAQGAIDHS